MALRRFKKWLKLSNDPKAKFLKNLLLRWRTGDLRFLVILGPIFFHEKNLRLTVWRWIKRTFYYNPMLRYRCKAVGRNPYIESSFPLIMGYGTVKIGDYLSVSGKTTLVVSYGVYENPTLEIGSNVAIGGGVVIAVAQKVTIGDHVGIGPGVQIYDNDSHPVDIDPVIRRKVVLAPENCAPVVLEEGCWITIDSIILKGVTIGKGSVIAPNSVVTEDIPPGVLAGGTPAKVIRPLDLNKKGGSGTGSSER